ncbi:MAG TPA: translocation/assembly module TamB domain-containing protein [Gemmatimonadota bacterium]|nr:translocation/assembly module TamB domain-containing protein [Gemmatimonadota bacterium]
MIFPEDFGTEPPPARGRARRGLSVGARLLLALVGLASLSLAAGSVLLTQTVVGREAVAAFVEGELDGLVQGDVELGPILGGNLVSRVLLDRFVIRDAEGEAFVELDSVRMDYNLLGLLAERYRFRNVTVQRARLRLLQDAGGTWNYDRIFAGDEDDDGPGGARVLLTDLAVLDGMLEVRTPWAAAPGPDELWRVEATDAGTWERVIRLDSLTGRFPLVRIVDPQRPMRFEIEGLAAHARAVRQDHRIVRFDGAATFRDSVEVDVTRLESDHSHLAGRGFVWSADPIQFDFRLEAEPVGLEDLQFLTVPVPDRGGGPASLRLRTREDGVMVTEVSDADVTIDDSHVLGGFVLHLEPTPRFADFDLEIAALRLALVDEVLEREALIDGVLSGTATGRGPITLLDVEADLVARDPPGTADPAEPSAVTLDGGIALVEPRVMRDLGIGMREFEPRWMRIVGIDPRFTGRANGTARLGGTAGGRIEFTLDTDHVLASGEASTVTGRGTMDLSTPGRSMLDVEFDFDPLAVRALAPWAPDLELEDVLRASVRGPMSARGRFDELRVAADFQTPRGQVTFDGMFDLEAEEKTYDAELLARDIQLDQWFEGGPETQLAVEGRVVGVGTDPGSLRARFDLVVLPSRVEGARVDSSIVRFTLSEGLAVADTFALRTEAGNVDGRGSFGLTADRSGSLILDVAIPYLARWNDWIVPERNPVREPDDVTDLFAQFGADAAPSDTAPPARTPEALPDTLAGSATALGVVYGNVDRFSLGGRAHLRQFEYGGHSADSLHLTVDVPDPLSFDTVTVRAAATDLVVFGRDFDALDLRWERRDSLHSSLALGVRRDTTVSLDANAEIEWSDAVQRVRLDRLDLQFGSRRLALRDTVRIGSDSAGFVAEEFALVSSDGASIDFGGIVPDAGEAHFDVAVRGVRLENLLELVGNPHDIAGGLTFGMTIRGTAAEPTWEGHLDIADPSVAGLGYDALTADLGYAGERLTIGAAINASGLELGRVDGYVRADLALRDVERRLLDDALNLDIVVDSMPLDALEIGIEAIRDVSGYARGRILVTGEPSALRFEGDTQLHRAAMFVPRLGVRLVGIEGRLVYAGSQARIDTLSIRSSAGGSADVGGTLELADLSDVGFNLEFSASGFRGIDRRMANVRVDGSGELTGRFREPELTGRFRLSEGDIRADRFMRQQQAVDLSDPAIYNLIDTTVVMEQRLFATARNPFTENLRMDAEIVVGPDLWLRSDAIEVELAGTLDVAMTQPSGEMVAFGTVRLPRGSFRYSMGQSTDITSILSRQLQVSRGTITFVGSPGMDPNLDVEAVFRTRSEIGPVEITVHVGGTALNPRMTTSSSPPLPNSERICYLLFASPCLGAGAAGSDVAASVLREGLIGQVGSQFSQVLVSGVGLIDYLDIRSTGGGNGLGGTSTGGLLYGTEVEIGRYLTSDLFLSATQPLGGLLPGAAVEWTFLPDYRLEFSTEDRARRYSAFGTSLNAFSNRTWRMMLFRQWNW